MGVPVRLNLRTDLRFRWTQVRAIWLLTALVIVGYPITSFLYWNLVLWAGILPTNGDSIGIPMLLDLAGAVILAVPIVGLTTLALALRAGPFRLWSWDPTRPVLSIVWSLALGGPALLLTALILRDVVRAMPWYAYLWLPHLSVVIAWLLVLRGAALARTVR